MPPGGLQEVPSQVSWWSEEGLVLSGGVMKRLYDNKTKETLCDLVRNGAQPKDDAKDHDVAAEVLRRWCRERDITWE